jgi:hypothetical protein
MRILGTAAGLGLAATLVAGEANAQNIIDMKGTWTATNQAIVDGPVIHHPPAGDPATKPAAKARLTEVPFTLVIEGQDGRRFWGTTSSPRHTERLIGSLSVDGKSIHMVDEDGFLDGTVVNADAFDVCYRQITKDAAVVGCGRVSRKK